ncbi:glycosyltransferase family 4 protein [Desulfofustis limnaeus]|uniref:Glycosyltransferase n=1 Tax=Desulfofustis limnaeus TaxID=2740163 RepID=A0ABM7W9J4_9BACT|nr:glycosyltransferase family 4 protein [Desulfofustis limnaeus]BDD87664.1 hypothetical protein DPPLL_20290 [Desulfofustis limnaeus]
MDNIIFLITRNDPSIRKGGSLATKTFINMLADVFNSNIVVMVTSSCDETVFLNPKISFVKVKARSFFEKLSGLFSIQLHRFKKEAQHFMRNNHKSIRFVIFDGSIVAGDIVNMTQKMNIPSITLHHNIESKYSIDEKTNTTLWGLTGYFINRAERNAYRKSSLNLALTNKDATDLMNLHDPSKKCYSIGCSDPYPHDLHDRTDQRKSFNPTNIKIIITGSLGDRQTEKGILSFLKNCYPELLRSYSGIKVTLAGRNPSKKLRSISEKEKNLVLISNPYDINDIVREADIFVCPVSLGSGIKLRLMDGLRNGLPIITHFNSVNGYDDFVGKKWFKCYSNTQEFLVAFDEIVEFLPKLERISVAHFYHKKFSYEAVKSKLFLVLLNQMHLLGLKEMDVNLQNSSFLNK